MSVSGDLRTFGLSDLLRWASAGAKTGVLELERNGISRRIEFRKGHVGSCSSNDPSSRLGQFLLSRGRINETQLQHLLTLQGVTGKRLGLLLVEMSILSRSELAAEVASKAEETIYSLFDWDDAFFRFDDGATLDPDQIEVNLPVERLISEGQERTKQLARIRETFESSGVVLARTDREISGELLERPPTRRILEAIDGKRSIAELLLHARASHFVVLHFLHVLHLRQLLEIREIRGASVEGATLLDPVVPHDHKSTITAFEWSDIEPGLERDTPNKHAAVAVDGIDVEIGQATRLMDEKDFDAAVDLLRSVCREHATDYALRLLHKAESALVNRVWEDPTFSTRFPVLLRDRDELLTGDRTPDESFLLSLIDGLTDVQAILWLTPKREVDVIIALQHMAKKGMIELVDPSPEELDSRIDAVGPVWPGGESPIPDGKLPQGSV